MEGARPAGGGGPGLPEWRADGPIGSKRGAAATNEQELRVTAAAEIRAPRGNQMRHIWTAAPGNCAAHSRGPTSAEHVPHVSPSSHLLFIYSFSQRSNQGSKFKTFLPRLMRDGARSHPTHSLIFMGLWDQKNRNSNNKSPAAV